MTALHKYTAVALIAFVLGLCAMYYATHRDAYKPMPTDDALVSRHTVTLKAPLKALDVDFEGKRVGAKEGKHRLFAFPHSIVPSFPPASTEVLATGKIKDDSGSRTIAAVVNTETGITQLVEKRPIMETMRRFEIGLGYGLESGDLAKALQLRATIGRLGPVYFTGQAEYFDVSRIVNRHPWNGMAFVNLRF